MDVLNSIGIFNTKDWLRKSNLYYYYVKGLYTVQSYRTNIFEATKLLDNGLWVGNLCSAFDKEGLEKNGIETIISAIIGAKAVHPFNYHYERAELRDIEDEDILVEIERLLPIIHKNLTEDKGVLVHCMEGRSRSVSICAAYLIQYLDYTVDEALDYIREKRSCIKPNSGYIEQLREFEQRVIATKIIKKKLK